MPVTGSTPLGAYELSEKPNELKPIPMLAVWVDPMTGDIAKLNKSRSIVDGALIEGLRVERKSGPAVMNVGQSLRTVRHTDPASIAELPAHAKEAAAELEKLGLVRVESTAIGDDSTEDAALVTMKVVDFTVRPFEVRPITVQRTKVP